MTQRITVSLPDDVAVRLDRESNASAFVTLAVRERMAREDTLAMLREHGFDITDGGRAQARAKIDRARERMTPERWTALRERYGRPEPDA